MTTKKESGKELPDKELPDLCQNEITNMGEVLVSLGDSLDKAGGCFGMCRRRGMDQNCDDDTMDVRELPDIMARNGIRFSVKEKS